MVKRFLILTVTLLISLSLFVPCSYAKADEINRDEIYEVLKNAVEIRNFMVFNFWWFDGGMGNENRDTNTVYLDADLGGGLSSYRYKKVAAGYSPDEVKTLVNNTLCDDLAAAVNNSQRLFGYYQEYDGAWYYLFTTPQHFPWNDLRLSVSEVDLKNFEIAGSADSELTVKFKATFIRDFETSFNPYESDVFVTLSETDEKWKVSGYDISSCFLSADASVMKGDSFTKEMAAESVKAAVFDVFYYSEIGSSLLTEKTVRISGSPESLGDPDTWKNYADGFMLPSVSDELLAFRGYLRLEDGRVVFPSDGRQSETVIFDYTNIRTDDISVISCDAEYAEVQFTLSRYRINNCADIVLDIEFTKTDDGWRISDTAFIDALRAHLNEADNVQTGDGNAAFTAAAVLILAACLISAMKKISLTRL